MSKPLSNVWQAKVDRGLRHLNTLIREDPDFWNPVFRAARQKSGYNRFTDWAAAHPKEFLRFVEMCQAQVDEGEEPQFSPNPDRGTVTPERVPK